MASLRITMVVELGLVVTATEFNCWDVVTVGIVCAVMNGVVHIVVVVVIDVVVPIIVVVVVNVIDASATICDAFDDAASSIGIIIAAPSWCCTLLS